jgi:hypothetical protein
MPENVAATTEPCNHLGTALWINNFSWWCGSCGRAVAFYNLIPHRQAHVPGEIVSPTDLEDV